MNVKKIKKHFIGKCFFGLNIINIFNILLNPSIIDEIQFNYLGKKKFFSENENEVHSHLSDLYNELKNNYTFKNDKELKNILNEIEKKNSFVKIINDVESVRKMFTKKVIN